MAHYTPGPVVHPTVQALLLATAIPVLSYASDRVGPEACKACHPAAYDAWRTSPHARARDSLSTRSRSDARCLSCHAPDIEDGLAGVTCEACHGPGRVYATGYVMRDAELARAVGLIDPGARACAGCHTESTPSLVKFEYGRKLPLIRHWEGEPKKKGR